MAITSPCSAFRSSSFGISLTILLLIAGLRPASGQGQGQRDADGKDRQVKTAVPEGYRLVWSDEFEGDGLDLSAWTHRTTRRGKISICRPENVSITDGKLRIACRREAFQGVPLTCGGAITTRQYRYGYYEVAARLHGGAGWHEAFWTTLSTDFDLTEAQRATPRIEIDCFEHYAEYDHRTFCCGVIEWHPIHGGLSRAIHKTTIDLSESFNVYGFEFTPEFINFFFNGELLATVDVRGVPHNPFHLWLSCIATRDAEDMRDGYCDFEYLRCYETDLNSAAYQARRRQFLAVIDRDSAPMQPSSGTDVWIEAEDFAEPGTWKPQRDGLARILKGASDRDKSASRAERVARTSVSIPRAGAYRMWVCSRDYAENMPGARHFQVAVNNRVSPQSFGTHGKEGYAWQDGGIFELPAAPAAIELIDASRYHARCDRILLTTDLEYRPVGTGNVPVAAPPHGEHP